MPEREAGYDDVRNRKRAATALVALSNIPGWGGVICLFLLHDPVWAILGLFAAWTMALCATAVRADA